MRTVPFLRYPGEDVDLQAGTGAIVALEKEPEFTRRITWVENQALYLGGGKATSVLSARTKRSYQSPSADSVVS